MRALNAQAPGFLDLVSCGGIGKVRAAGGFYFRRKIVIPPDKPP